jgi:hypothetical protein
LVSVGLIPKTSNKRADFVEKPIPDSQNEVSKSNLKISVKRGNFKVGNLTSFPHIPQTPRFGVGHLDSPPDIGLRVPETRSLITIFQGFGFSNAESTWANLKKLNSLRFGRSNRIESKARVC